MMWKMTAVVLCAALLCGSLGSPGRAAEPEGSATDKQTFLVIYRPGPAYDPAKSVRAQALGGHGKYLLELYKSGDMKFAGPFTDDWGGGVVLSVADQAAAEAIAKNDPAVLSGVFVWEVHPWYLVPWEERAK